MEKNKSVEEVIDVAEKIVGHINKLEAKVIEDTTKLETHIEKLEREVAELKKKPL